MPEFGYHMSAEEHAPLDLVRHAKRAEEEGFGYALVSDHFHPWLDAQGHAAFVWSVIGGIAVSTERLELGTGVTCPLIRTHPAIIAHAAATAATMMPGRFFLGVGTGENLNEHILGDRWPAPDERLDMLEEAIELMRTLWEGGYQTFRGDYYVAEQAKIYDLPEEPMRVMVAASKPNAAELAGREGDGLITTAPDEEVISSYREAGGSGPIYGKVTLVLGGERAGGAGDGVQVVRQHGGAGRAEHRARATASLRAGGGAARAVGHGRSARMRAGPGAGGRAGARVRAGGARSPVLPPGRARPGGASSASGATS
jgi:G6PDH family F420-dependent oxidoreductase